MEYGTKYPTFAYLLATYFYQEALSYSPLQNPDQAAHEPDFDYTAKQAAKMFVEQEDTEIVKSLAGDIDNILTLADSDLAEVLDGSDMDTSKAESDYYLSKLDNPRRWLEQVKKM